MYYRIKSGIGGNTVYLSVQEPSQILTLATQANDDHQLWQVLADMSNANSIGLLLLNKAVNKLLYSDGKNGDQVVLVDSNNPIDGVVWNRGSNDAISLASTGGSQNLNVKNASSGNPSIITYEWQSNPIGRNEQWTWEQAS